jgi:hypothetical protein
VFAQTNKKRVFSIGVAASAPPSFSFNGSTHATSVGIDIAKERYFSPGVSWTLTAGYDYFIGEYSFYDWKGASGMQAPNDSVRNFALIPLTIGLRYYFWKTFYLAGEGGLNIATSAYTGTHPMLRPAAGVLIPAGQVHIDAGIKWTYITEGGGIPESNGLKRGGYRFWSLRVALVF